VGLPTAFFVVQKGVFQMNDKKSLRKHIIETLSKLSKTAYEEDSITIHNRLFEDPDWIQANVIGITISKFPEVDTYQIIKKAWESGKQIVVPKCYSKERQLSFRTLTDFSQLESVYYGLLEPIEAVTKELEPGEIDLLIVPGVVYSREGYRIGFGGGYYDRFLTRFSGKTLSLAFSCQVIDKFDKEDHDMKIAKIITNVGVFTI